ncbi:hypothetical protein STRAU_0531 [Streptomyces aurantiacus JA 4570]|uniref:Uncharacterized protein n=1 Tax=Streptomyces aurantiacus JA 4570 TaxID=1286094 RepID=S4A6I4_9ACTN|nr:hypothetical protein STRAU_0531 [Streptomyces aurantiacus JA 4570]
MKCIVAGHAAVTAAEFVELALAELREVDPLAAAYARALLRASDLPRRASRPWRVRRASARRAGICAVQGAAVAA